MIHVLKNWPNLTASGYFKLGDYVIRGEKFEKYHAKLLKIEIPLIGPEKLDKDKTWSSKSCDTVPSNVAITQLLKYAITHLLFSPSSW